MKRAITILSLIGMALIILVSCHKRRFMQEIDPNDLNQVQISDDFDWKIIEPVDMNIEVPFDGFVQIISEDHKILYAKGISSERLFSRTIILPSYTENVTVVFNGQFSTIPIIGGTVDYVFTSTKAGMLSSNLVENGDFEDTNYSFIYLLYLNYGFLTSNLDNWILKTWENSLPNTDIHELSGNDLMRMTDNDNSKHTFACYYTEADPLKEYTFSVDASIFLNEGNFTPYITIQFLNSSGQAIVSYNENITATTMTSYSIIEDSPIGTEYIKISLATSYWGKGEAHFDNVVLTVESADTDGDGVIDDDDDYPNDASRAFDTYFPSDTTGRIAFEDTWPAKADYDFNDMVIDYKFKVVSNASSYVVEILADIAISNIGAGYTNGFGFQLPDNSHSWYTSVSGVVGNSFESNQTYPTVIVFNTSNASNEGDNYPITFTLNANTATESDISIQNWNPFLLANGQRGYEIHLPYHAPTDMADLTLFGTNYDDGNPNDWNGTKLSGVYKTYLTQNNMPWVINVYAQFNWTIERSAINTGHLHFVDWATSSGTDYQDWFFENGSTGTKTGYRDVTQIDYN